VQVIKGFFGQMIENEKWKILGEAVVAYFKVVTQHFLGEAEQKP
jgi:hypothetical protein